MPISKEGAPLISLVLCGSVALVWAGLRFNSSFLLALAVIGLLKFVFLCYFFRDPQRQVPPIYQEGKTLLSPADGKVLEIANEPDGKSTTLRIFLSVFNVHIQRSPVRGKIIKLEQQGVKYLPAMKEKAHKENKQNIITIENNLQEKFIVKQIVGILARRLVLWKKEGDNLLPAERIGMIKFGSQVDITFPSSYKTKLSTGDIVRGGETIIAAKM